MFRALFYLLGLAGQRGEAFNTTAWAGPAFAALTGQTGPNCPTCPGRFFNGGALKSRASQSLVPLSRVSQIMRGE